MVDVSATAHGIDPDNPQNPSELHQISSNLGKASRGDFPYVGSDFVQTRTDPPVYSFLETNIVA